jgi:hypothetical protein
MPAAVVLMPQRRDQVAQYVATIRALGRGCGDSTVQAARTFTAKLQRAGGWEHLSVDARVDAIVKARAFACWLMVTGQLTVDAEVLGRVDLWFGHAACLYCPDAYRWFTSACAVLNLQPAKTWPYSGTP